PWSAAPLREFPQRAVSDCRPRDGELNVERVVVVVPERAAGRARRAGAGDLLQGIASDGAIGGMEKAACGIVCHPRGVDEVDPAVHEEPEVVWSRQPGDREDPAGAELRPDLDDEASEV